MKEVRRDVDEDGRGHITLIAEDSEDLWHVFNVLREGDHFRSTTVRRVTKETSTGTTDSERKRITLTILVHGIDFNPGAECMRVSGRNAEENKYVKTGAHHTIDLMLNKKFTIHKDQWDSVDLEVIKNACDPTQQAEVAAVIMSEGMAHICLITGAMTILVGKVECSIPRKRPGSASRHDKGLEKFYELVLQGIIRHIRFDLVKCVLVGSPGFVKDQFYEWMNAQAVKRDLRVLIENKSKFLLVHSSSGHKGALKEILADPAIASRLENTKAAGEVRLLNSFFQMLQNDPDRAFYGYDHCARAAAAAAIEHLLITDELFRAADVPTRRRYIALIESVRESGGSATIFSTLHVTGEQLAQHTGVAAILRFPMPEIDEEDEEEEDSDEEEDEDEDQE
eukprot:TRINITY_DN1478_c0_g4_i1.p1 TRINITY_DN1478_c0_g4~~TRINITY_DN1478_c0_g4_i1.p1  ORF type:complete len:395 (-),score=169.86 TRINITY_DN1478_c0_g4_i1:287-1471(-)